ncbi:MAG TPA: LacI family transcriptional regulator, partial [Firmicutes bacterium]|nr:LacI family transcriptional regulator [Bacillota bacterium]
MSDQNITLRDVAQKAGVSHTTVSQVLNNKGRISGETRKRILKMIQEMKYYPNDSARHLAVGKPDTIAFISPRLAGPFISDVMSGFEDRAYQLN